MCFCVTFFRRAFLVFDFNRGWSAGDRALGQGLFLFVCSFCRFARTLFRLVPCFTLCIMHVPSTKVPFPRNPVRPHHTTRLAPPAPPPHETHETRCVPPLTGAAPGAQRRAERARERSGSATTARWLSRRPRAGRAGRRAGCAGCARAGRAPSWRGWRRRAPVSGRRRCRSGRGTALGRPPRSGRGCLQLGAEKKGAGQVPASRVGGGW